MTFHDGSTFDADDVVFSFERASDENSDIQAFFATIDRVETPDPLTVEFYTKKPDPLFPSGIANWLIMDRTWTEAKGAPTPGQGGWHGHHVRGERDRTLPAGFARSGCRDGAGAVCGLVGRGGA